MIKLTPGRIVWFRPAGTGPDSAPLAAIVVHIYSDTLINLAVWDSSGRQFIATSVTLYQGEGDRPKGQYAEWMPYQQGQAAKAEALAKQINGGVQ